MPVNVLLSTAYLPPAEYLSVINNATIVTIEKEESYHKQTYRNRCRILTANGVMNLTVPVMKSSINNTPVKDITIDYSKRWQQVHLRAMIAAYNSSPFFQYYFDDFEKIILKNYKYLLDLNEKLLVLIIDILKINVQLTFSSSFSPPDNGENDFRYRITPRIIPAYEIKKYSQVFSQGDFMPGLSIIDLIFNMGPDSKSHL